MNLTIVNDSHCIGSKRGPRKVFPPILLVTQGPAGHPHLGPHWNCCFNRRAQEVADPQGGPQLLTDPTLRGLVHKEVLGTSHLPLTINTPGQQFTSSTVGSTVVNILRNICSF